MPHRFQRLRKAPELRRSGGRPLFSRRSSTRSAWLIAAGTLLSIPLCVVDGLHGADETHWSFRAPQRPELPAVQRPAWVRNAVDAFVLARLEHEGLSPSPPAARSTLLRRLSFDLTGLPPTPAERRAYLSDDGPGAYERAVDRLLASPHFGERLALEWLDAARYADTYGYHEDYHRDMWPWREWVIEAFNQNKPFDVFTREQLAGDLLPQPTNAQQVATGFHRLHGVTSSGIPEEYRVEYVVDRVNTVASAWLGLTLGCAQCHDHKYDPVSQREYYAFYAFFNNIADPAIMGHQGGNLEPSIPLERPEERAALESIRKQLAQREAERKVLVDRAEPSLTRWEESQRARHAKLTRPPAPLLHAALDDPPASGLTGTAQTTRGPAGVALVFDGKTHVDLEEGLELRRDRPFSYGAWVRPTGGGAILSRMKDDDAFRGWDLYYTGTHVEAHVIHRWPENAIHCRSREEIPPGSWYHIFLTYDGSSRADGMTLYIDGKKIAVEVTRDSLADPITVDGPVSIGRRNPSGNFQGDIADVRVYGTELSADAVATLAVPERALLERPTAERTAEQAAAVRHAFLSDANAEYRNVAATIDELAAQEKALVEKMSGTTVMVMREMAEPRKTFVLDRGRYDQPREEVTTGVPAALSLFPETAPKNRLGLAEWLLQPRHPLTSRVAVNRLWQMLFGTGLVRTQEDFGVQGEPPSHPRLLDWLAVEYVESGWNTKDLVRLLVTSQTYRQASDRGTSARRDPDNRLLARGPRFRLAAELIRDVALASSGLLVRSLGGPSVKPYQPPGLWLESHTRKYVQDSGAKLYRRSLYTYWKRALPPPNMVAFDAPNREICTARRQRTNTPSTALVLMNDPTFVEASRHLARRVLKNSATSDAGRVAAACELVLGRTPQEAETREFLAFLAEQRDTYATSPESAALLLEVGESPRDTTLDALEHATWTTLASILLSLDEAITKE